MLYIKSNELKALGARYRKNWWLFALSFCGCMAIAALFIFVKNKKYEVYTSVNITGGSTGSSMMATMAKNSGFGDILGMGGTEVDNELTIMQSHHVLYNAVKEIGMNVDYNSRPKVKRLIYWGDSPIQLIPDDANYSDTLQEYLRFKVKLNADGTQADITCKTTNHGRICDLENVSVPGHFDTEWGGFSLATTEYFKPGKSMKVNVGWGSYTACAQKLMRDMSFKLLDKKADIVQISYKDANPNRTIALLNAIVHCYELYSIEAKNHATSLSSEMLQQRIDTVTSQLADLEVQVENYKRQHDLAYPELEAKLAVEQMVDLKQQLIELEVQSSNIAMLRKYVQDPEHKYDPLPLVASVGSTKDGSAMADYNNAILQYQNLQRSAIGDNPALTRAQNNLETLRQAVLLTLNNMQGAIDKARSEAQREQDKVLSMKSNAPVMEREYVELVRQQELKQKVMLMLQAQQEQNALTINQDTPKGQLVDEAYVNVLPSGPKASVILVIAFFFALFLPAAFLKVLDLLCPTLQSPEQLKELEGFHGDIHTLNNQQDIQQLSREIAARANTMTPLFTDGYKLNVCLVSMQGAEETGTLANDLRQEFSNYLKEGSVVTLTESPAFTQQLDALYDLREADLALLVVRQGITRKENLTYIETLIDKGLMQEMLTAYQF